MADTRASAPVIDNAPGGLVLPPWLLLLDQPDPRRILVVGETAPSVLDWFGEQGATIDHLSASQVGAEIEATEGPDPHADLVIVGSGVTRELASLGGLSWLRGLAPTAAAVLPWRRTAKLTHRIGQAGFGCIRAVDDDTRPLPWRSSSPIGVVVLPEGPVSRPPAWLARSIEETVGTVASSEVGWSLGAPGRYPSQKAVVMLRDRTADELVGVVKVTRHARFNTRLRNEHQMLEQVGGLGGALAAQVPVSVSVAPVASVVALTQRAVPGGPLIERSTFTASCPLIERARSAASELGRSTAHKVPGSVLAEPLWDAHQAVVERQHAPPEVAEFLADQIHALAAAPEVPAVLWHGDLGCWNVFENQGDVFLLDWESAQPTGPPLWDLFYLARSFAVRSGRRRGLTRRRAIDRHLVGTSPLNQVISQWVESAVAELSLDPALVEPLFHTCWMHRAAREGARLSKDQPGHYGPLCVSLVERRASPGIRRLVLATQDDRVHESAR